MIYSSEPTEKSGYLNEEYRLFHIKDQTEREYHYHYHDFHKVIVFLSGKAAYHIEGKSYHLKPWDILLVNRGAIHKPEIDTSVPYERFVLWIREDISHQELTACFQRAHDRSFNFVRLHSQVQERLKDILLELESALHGDAYCSELLSGALFCQFMVYLNRIFLAEDYVIDRKSYTFDSQVEDLVRYINRNLDKDLCADTLAQKYYLSKYHMMRKFKAETGYTLHNYVVSKRLLMARSLISQGVPVMKAASQSGFRDYTTFVRAYKKQFGASPTKN